MLGDVVVCFVSHLRRSWVGRGCVEIPQLRTPMGPLQWPGFSPLLRSLPGLQGVVGCAVSVSQLAWSVGRWGRVVDVLQLVWYAWAFGECWVTWWFALYRTYGALGWGGDAWRYHSCGPPWGPCSGLDSPRCYAACLVCKGWWGVPLAFRSLPGLWGVGVVSLTFCSLYGTRGRLENVG